MEKKYLYALKKKFTNSFEMFYRIVRISSLFTAGSRSLDVGLSLINNSRHYIFSSSRIDQRFSPMLLFLLIFLEILETF